MAFVTMSGMIVTGMCDVESEIKNWTLKKIVWNRDKQIAYNVQHFRCSCPSTCPPLLRGLFDRDMPQAFQYTTNTICACSP